jgi:hypothetical protein
MPSRWMCLTIVAFWLATTGWLFWTDVLPELTPGQPPPFTIDLLDEVNQKYSEALWTVSINGKETHKAITRIRQHAAGSRLGWLSRPLADDAFELSIAYREMLSVNQGLPGGVRLVKMDSAQLVTPRGQLLATDAFLELQLRPRPDIPFSIHLSLSGEMQGGQFLARLRVPEAKDLDRPLGDLADRRLEPISVPPRPVILNPMHPVARMKGLRPRQSWQVPQFDPLAVAVAASAGLDLRNRMLKAHVLAEVQTIVWRGQPRRCLKVEYHKGSELLVETWVDEATGRVLRQEATCDGYTVTLELASDIDGL